jgi:hypothetical protein
MTDRHGARTEITQAEKQREKIMKGATVNPSTRYVLLIFLTRKKVVETTNHNKHKLQFINHMKTITL